MFDGFKLQLPFAMKELLLENDLLDFSSTFSHKTGELRSESLFAIYPTKSKNPLLQFKIKHSYIEVSGSFHKYFQNGTNANDFSFSDFELCVKELETKFGIKPNEAIVHNLEFGVNIVTKGTTASEIIDLCMLYKTKGFDHESFDCKGKMKRAVLRQYEVKIYDKGVQYHLGGNLLRIEKKVKKMEQLGEVHLQMLLQPNFIYKASEQLLNVWNDVILFEPNLCLNKAGKPLQTIYANWGNPNYINKLVVDNLRKFKYERMRYKELISENCNNSIHNQIAESLWNGLIEFEKRT